MRLLELLEGTRETGAGRYLARCPAHDDRSPSLSVKECDDGRTLIHCFAGCEPLDILNAVGLRFSDIMPEDVGADRQPGTPKWIPAKDILATLDHESLVVAVIAGDMQEHREIDVPTWARLSMAVARIGRARDVCTPARHRK